MRRLAFAGVVVALGAVLLLFGLRSSQPTEAEISTVGFIGRLTKTPRRPSPARPPAPPGALRQARRFVGAFLSYEVGSGGGWGASVIRSGASHAFADELLARPPTQPRSRTAARLARLRVSPVPGHADLALLSGEARRRAGPEPFAFLFARRDGRWLAVAPGE